MRKEADFEVMDRIKVYYAAKGNAAEVFARNKEEIAGEVLADALLAETAPEAAYSKEWSINGEKVKLAVEKSL